MCFHFVLFFIFQPTYAMSTHLWNTAYEGDLSQMYFQNVQMVLEDTDSSSFSSLSGSSLITKSDASSSSGYMLSNLSSLFHFQHFIHV